MIQESSVIQDSFGRVMRDLRISVTDRCNFRCLYCLPETEEAADFYRAQRGFIPKPEESTHIHRLWKPKSEILRFEEIERIVRIAAGFGIRKFRLTGGEPLLRRNLDELVAKLAAVPGCSDLTMTTNGFLFGPQARKFKEAGLDRISFSLDSLDPKNFKRITGRTGLNEVVESIREAKAAGFDPVKVNAVAIRDMNEHELVDLAEFGRREGVVMRFIEFMPLDSKRTWLKDMVVPGKEILDRLSRHYAFTPVKSGNRSETASRWKYEDMDLEFGIIASVTQSFCGHCNRIRLTADGFLRTCLFSLNEHDLKPLLRGGASDQSIEDWFREKVYLKEERHHIGEEDFVQPERTMSCIGG